MKLFKIKGMIAVFLILLCPLAPAEKPKRIISLNPSTTEILCALNADENLIGVTEFCPFPKILAAKTNVGTILDPDIEKIISEKPDIVFATLEGNRMMSIDSLRNAGVKVFALGNVRNFDDLYRYIDKMGNTLHRQKEAKRLIRRMNAKITRIKEKVKKRKKIKTFLQLGSNPIVTVNRDTIINEIVELGGGQNIARDAPIRYAKYSFEAVVSQNPDAIIIVSMGKFGQETLKRWGSYKNINAVKNGRICIIDSNLICHMGPRLVDGLEKVAKFLHPEEFEKKMQ